MQKLYHGAEAVITKLGNTVVKNRVKKGYRIKEIDERLRKKRTRTEAKLIREARRAGVETPFIVEEGDFSISMEFVDGRKVKDVLNAQTFMEISENIGKSIALLHDYGIIHGDLTTSNMIVTNGQVCFLDFGLGFFSKRAEDKATDLHVLKEALVSTHHDVEEEAWRAIIRAYRSSSRNAEGVIRALSKIEKRGRYMVRE